MERKYDGERGLAWLLLGLIYRGMMIRMSVYIGLAGVIGQIIKAQVTYNQN